MLAALALTAALPMSAKADLIQFNNGTGVDGCVTANCNSFVDLGAQGFGNNPRVLTVQTNTSEQGEVAPDGAGGVAYPTTQFNPNQAIQNGNNKGNAPSVASLNWQSGANVGIGFNADQQGNTGITLQSLSLKLYNGTTVIGVFSIPNPITFLANELAKEPGNGNAIWGFVLDATQQAQWNALIASNPLAALAIGLSSSLGCSGTPSTTCVVSNDGPDSFYAIAGSGGVPFNSPVPLPGAVWLFSAGLGGLFMLTRRKKKKAVTT